MNNKIMALGIDQGIANLGYCVIETDRANKGEPIILKSGVLETTNAEMFQDRIWYLFNQLDEVLRNYPDICIIGTESLFVNNFKNGGRNKSAAIVTTNMITGVIMLLGAKHKKLVKQYTPGTVKKYITGAGDASKGSVEENLSHIIQKSNVDIKADHQSDAIAIAWTSSMDVMDNGLTQLTLEASTPKASKRSKKAKIVKTKEFHLQATSWIRLSNQIEHAPDHLAQLDEDKLEKMDASAIIGQFKKARIVLISIGGNFATVRVGVEVGKKSPFHNIIIPETIWYSIEVKGIEKKSINRTFGNLKRKLEKNTDYQLKPNGKIMETITNETEDKCDMQFYIEVEPRI